LLLLPPPPSLKMLEILSRKEVEVVDVVSETSTCLVEVT
jgi:hypothetical protein